MPTALLNSSPKYSQRYIMSHSSMREDVAERKSMNECSDIAPPRPFASVRFDPLAWSSGSDQRRISGCGIRWLLAGPDSLPLWLCRVCAFVLLRCFSCSHTVLPKEHSLGIIFFSSLSSCKCCIFLQFYLHFTTDYTCMIVYVTNNKEPEPEVK